MRVTVIPEPKLGLGPLTIQVNYNQSVQNLLYLVSLQVTIIQINKLQLFFRGKPLKPSMNLQSIGITEDSALDLRELEDSGCCSLLQVKQMEGTDSLLSKTRRTLIVYSFIGIIINTASIVFICVVLLTSSSDCQFPIRLWLEAVLGYSGLNLITTCLMEIYSLKIKYSSRLLVKVIYVVYALLFVCLIGLVSVGSYWFYSSTDCEQDFWQGYWVMFVVLVVYYSVLGIYLLCVCSTYCIGTCIGAALLKSD